jgi:quercetin dioxygenase-like cupin family protein
MRALILALVISFSAHVHAGESVEPAPHAVVHAKDAKTQVAPSGKAKIIHLALGKKAFLGRLELAPGAKVPLHRDATEEYIHVLSGGGTITVDGQVHVLTAGSTVYMPALAEVTFANGDAPMVAIQVFAGPAPAAKYQKWPVSGAKIKQEK